MGKHIFNGFGERSATNVLIFGQKDDLGLQKIVFMLVVLLLVTNVFSGILFG